MVGFLLQWPTLPTLVMFPFLVIVYRRLASSEERSVRREFADVWDDYAAATPRFIPRPPATQTPAPPPRHRSGGPIDRPGGGAPPGEIGRSSWRDRCQYVQHTVVAVYFKKKI